VREAQPDGNGSPRTVVNTRRLCAELARGRYGATAGSIARISAPWNRARLQPVNPDPNSHWHFPWALWIWRALRSLYEEVWPVLEKEVWPALKEAVWPLTVAFFAAIAAFGNAVVGWFRETDWELMVNRVFPRKKDRGKSA
jgi:hypothetical protein